NLRKEKENKRKQNSKARPKERKQKRRRRNILKTEKFDENNSFEEISKFSYTEDSVEIN
ncbi:hypothetical protein NPIL_259861, partial [Nephila pilipes]